MATDVWLPSYDTYQTVTSRTILELSTARWGRERATVLVGKHPRLENLLARLMRFATAQASFLVTGETGTGKDLLAQSIFLTAGTHRRTLVSVNCAQFQNDQLAASELFGHRKGAFTGALADHRGIFEEADGGFVFLDEVAELPLAVQAMLLRVLDRGEVVPVGTTHPRRVDTRVIAATNRDLPDMISRGLFREDLYYRLRHLTLHTPPLRERGDDWDLLSQFLFERLARRNGKTKRFSPEVIDRLADYHWPGNVRELAGCVEIGYCMAQSSEVSLGDIEDALQANPRGRAPHASAAPGCGARVSMMADGTVDFWTDIQEPFMNRDLNRIQMQEIIAEGLRRSNGSYKRMVALFGLPVMDYMRFMDFLRHHSLKPLATNSVIPPAHVHLPTDM